MSIFKYFLFSVLSLLLINCQPGQKRLYLGADLSYVNEMEDCGAIYQLDGRSIDPYKLFADKGCNIFRVRLWHSPGWTNYSTVEDVKKTIRRARNNGMEVLLDFHYSDTWADPQKQIIPKAWVPVLDDMNILGDSVYNYTLKTLNELSKEGLMPEFVQVGNEINIEILQDSSNMVIDSIDWKRNSYLLNKGIEAVNKAMEETGNEIEIMLHIAQPENAIPWFEKAFENNIADFDWIGLSYYYPKWSNVSIHKLPEMLNEIKRRFEKRIMIVETAYPHAIKNFDDANNIMWSDALDPEYPDSPQGQLNFLIDLTNSAILGGCEGVIYWEPAWVSSSCSTSWGKGSHWDNATFFDAFNHNEALPAFDFFKQGNYQ